MSKYKLENALISIYDKEETPSRNELHYMRCIIEEASIKEIDYAINRYKTCGSNLSNLIKRLKLIELKYKIV